MSGLPLLLRGTDLLALVVGGGAVALRRVRSLLDGGARVRVVAPACHPELESIALDNARLELQLREWRSGDVGDAMLVVAATDDRELNARIASEGLAAGRLVNVADSWEEGNVTFPAVHRAESLVIAVSAGGVPGAASKVRDEIAARFDERYASVLGSLARLRARMIGDGEAAAWRRAWSELGGAEFCAEVESGRLIRRLAAWR